MMTLVSTWVARIQKDWTTILRPTTQVVAITQTLAQVTLPVTARWMSTTCLTSSNFGATSATKIGPCLTKWNGSPLGGPFFFCPNEGRCHPFGWPGPQQLDWKSERKDKRSMVDTLPSPSRSKRHPGSLGKHWFNSGFHVAPAPQRFPSMAPMEGGIVLETGWPKKSRPPLLFR